MDSMYVAGLGTSQTKDDRSGESLLDVLDRIQHGVFAAVYLIPSAATWSRARHSRAPGHLPLRPGLNHLAYLDWTLEHETKVQQSNTEVEMCPGWQLELFVAFRGLRSYISQGWIGDNSGLR